MPGQVGEQEEAAEGSWQLSCSWHPSSCWGQRLARQAQRHRTALSSRTPSMGHSLWKQHLRLTCPTQRTRVSQPCLELTPCPLCPPGLLPALLHLQRSDSASILSDSGRRWVNGAAVTSLFLSHLPLHSSAPNPLSLLRMIFPPLSFCTEGAKTRQNLRKFFCGLVPSPPLGLCPSAQTKGKR